jgi:hypothetical protein
MLGSFFPKSSKKPVAVLNSSGPDEVAVFSNGSLVFRSNEDPLQPILLTDEAQPGGLGKLGGSKARGLSAS